MGEIDVCTGEYMAVQERCADAINGGFFHGKRVVLPEQIHEMDTISNAIIKNTKKSEKEVIGQRRDIVKVAVYDTNFCIIGVENQTDIHYVLPIRNMLYDAVQYRKQWNKIKKRHKVKKDLKGTEYISGFSKNDSLRAVVTLVVYYGTAPWDGAKDIHSLIDWTDIPEDFKEIVPNYSIHLLELNKYSNLDDFQSDLKSVCRFIQNSNDDKKLEEMLKNHGDEFENMEEDTYDLIGVLGNMTQLAMIKDKYKKEDGGFDMCKGMDDWLKRREEEGRIEGRNEGAHNKLCEIVEKNLDKGKTAEEIADFLGENMKTIEELIEEIKETR